MSATTDRAPLPRLAYTVEEFAQMTGLSEEAVRKQARKGELPFRKHGRRWVIPAKAAEALFDG